MQKRVAIIGGGASGMVAAISASKGGHHVTLFEKNESLGKKILLTGNGRCNITNANVSWRNYFGTHPKFAASVLSKFTNAETIQFFEELGLILREEDRGRIFPRSNQAQSVIDVLSEELERLCVEVKYNHIIKEVERGEKVFILKTSDNKRLLFDKLILATGGKSFPHSGSTGDGYRFAKQFGHHVIKPFPVSTPFRMKSLVCNKLQGIKVNACLKIMHNEKIVSQKEGELLYTHLGISAPVVLESSREVSRILAKNPDAKVVCSINLFPEYSREQISSILRKRFLSYPSKNLANQFIGILPRKIAPVLFRHYHLNPEMKSDQVSKKLLSKLVSILTDHRESIQEVLSWNAAQFTAGGVDTKQIDSQTMESKLMPGLFFCGEVVDIDGQSGGYNLQWAWSSGYVAGNSI